MYLEWGFHEAELSCRIWQASAAKENLLSLFARKSLDSIIAESEAGEHKLRRTLGPWNLMALGIGAIIGAGLF